MAGAFPLKAIVQTTGDVVLGEFLESDFVGILDGGTGAGGNGGLPDTATDSEKLLAIKGQVRSNFDLIKFDTYNTLAELQSEVADSGRLALLNSNLYYSTGSSWIALAEALTVDTNITGNIEFAGSIISTYDPTTNTTTASLDLTPLQSELDTTQSAAGLNADGTYTADGTTNYLTTSTSLKDSDGLLDSAIFSERTRAIGVETTIITDQNTIENNLQNFEYSGHTSAQVSAAGKVSIAYDINTGKFVPDDNFGTGGFIKFTKTNGTRDDIPLTTTFTGNEMISGEVDFFMANGTQDNIDLIINGV